MTVDGVIFRISYVTGTTFTISIIPETTPRLIDMKRVSINGTAVSSTIQDNYTLAGTLSISPNLNGGSNSITWIWFRVQNPDTLLWNEYEATIFVSGGNARASMWAYLVQENISYS